MLFGPKKKVIGVVGSRVRQEQVVRAQVVPDAGGLDARREGGPPVPVQADLLGLVEGDPDLHPVPELVEEEAGVLLVPVDEGGVREPPQFLQGHRQVPVVHGHHGDDLVGQELVDQVVVVGEALLVDFVREAVGEDARPRDGEAVKVDFEVF